jgi:hypothetical protein
MILVRSLLYESIVRDYSQFRFSTEDCQASTIYSFFVQEHTTKVTNNEKGRYHFDIVFIFISISKETGCL